MANAWAQGRATHTEEGVWGLRGSFQFLTKHNSYKVLPAKNPKSELLLGLDILEYYRFLVVFPIYEMAIFSANSGT